MTMAQLYEEPFRKHSIDSSGFYIIWILDHRGNSDCSCIVFSEMNPGLPSADGRAPNWQPELQLDKASQRTPTALCREPLGA